MNGERGNFESVSNDQEGGGRELKTPNEVWLGMKESVIIDLDARIRPYFDALNRSLGEAHELEDEFEGFRSREQRFIEKIWEQIENLVKVGQKNIAVLFDIDETIGRAHYDSNNNVSTILRPAVQPLFDELNIWEKEGVSTDLGILSTRGPEQLRRQLSEEHHLQSVASLLSSELIFGTKELADLDEEAYFMADRLSNGMEQEAVWLEFQERCGTFLNAAMLDEYVRPGDQSNREWRRSNLLSSADFHKLLFIDVIMKKYPDKAFLVVDDINYPKYLDHPRLKGVCLDGEKFRVD